MITEFLFRHLHNVGDIGKLVITAEEAIAKGIRRIIALTGPEAYRAVHLADRLEQRVLEAHNEIAADNSVASDTTQFKAATKRVLELIEVLLHIL